MPLANTSRAAPDGTRLADGLRAFFRQQRAHALSIPFPLRGAIPPRRAKPLGVFVAGDRAVESLREHLSRRIFLHGLSAKNRDGIFLST